MRGGGFADEPGLVPGEWSGAAGEALRDKPVLTASPRLFLPIPGSFLPGRDLAEQGGADQAAVRAKL